MIGVLVKTELEHEADSVLVDIALDFIRAYADRTHHGKEEDLLLQELKKEETY